MATFVVSKVRSYFVGDITRRSPHLAYTYVQNSPYMLLLLTRHLFSDLHVRLGRSASLSTDPVSVISFFAVDVTGVEAEATIKRSSLMSPRRPGMYGMLPWTMIRAEVLVRSCLINIAGDVGISEFVAGRSSAGAVLGPARKLSRLCTTVLRGKRGPVCCVLWDVSA
jgi:hypothetical protein